MTCVQFNYSVFIQYYTAFSNSAVYPEPTLQLYWNEATTYIIDQLGAFGFRGAQQVRALNLMTAHLAQLNTLIAAGQGTGVMVAATIDKVSIQLQPPPEVNQWQWWLNQTPYGQQLLALLQGASVGGFYVAGFCQPFQLRR